MAGTFVVRGAALAIQGPCPCIGSSKGTADAVLLMMSLVLALRFTGAGAPLAVQDSGTGGDAAQLGCGASGEQQAGDERFHSGAGVGFLRGPVFGLEEGADTFVSSSPLGQGLCAVGEVERAPFRGGEGLRYEGVCCGDGGPRGLRRCSRPRSGGAGRWPS